MGRRPLLTLLLALAAGALAGRALAATAPLVRGPEPSLALEKRILDRYLKGDLLEVLRLTEGAAGRPLFYRGMFLSDLGLLGAGREALEGAASALPAGDPAREEAIQRILGVARLDTTLPPPSAAAGRGIGGRTALDLGGSLLSRGDLRGGLEVLSSVPAPEAPDTRALGVAVTAQAQAAGGRPAQALSTLDSFHARETSPTSDLVYLLRGFHHLAANEIPAARDAFLEIPAESLFAPEARHGMAWVQIRSGNLPAAVVRLEELLRAFPSAPVSRQAALDLALTYRDLGMFDQAAKLLTGEMRTLTEGREWLESLRAEDLAGGGDLALLVDDALQGRRSHPEAWKRSPAFARDFALAVSTDPQMGRLAALGNGALLLGEASHTLRKRYADVGARLAAHRAWLAGLDQTLGAWRAGASGHLGRLPSLRGEYLTAMQSSPLRETASPDDLLLLERVAKARERILFLSTAQDKARGFSGVIRELTGADLPLPEQKQLRKIRQEAFDGILQTRSSVEELEERLKSLEGRVWLGVKLAAAAREVENRKRAERMESSASATIAAAARALDLAKQREADLAAQAAEVEQLQAGLGGPLTARLEAFASRLAAARTTRLLALARERARAQRDLEARVLYTAADIEISKMEDRLKRLQQGEAK